MAGLISPAQAVPSCHDSRMRALLYGGAGILAIGLLLIPLPGPGLLVAEVGCAVLAVGALGLAAIRRT